MLSFKTDLVLLASSSRENLYKHTENNEAKIEYAFGLGELGRQRIGAATSENYL